MGLFDDVLKGSGSGTSAVPGIGTAVGALAGFVPSLYKIFSGINQKNKANAINATNPGYQINQGVLDNANLYRDRYLNYQLPGYGTAKNDINTGAATAFNTGINGASSSGDVLGLAADIAYGRNKSLNQLNSQSAQGKDAALADYTNAEAQAGQQYVNKNQYDNEVYQQKLREKAGLTQAANENIYGGIGTAAALTSAYLNPRGKTDDTASSSGSASILPSIFKSSAAPTVNTNAIANYQTPNGTTDWYTYLNSIRKNGGF